MTTDADVHAAVDECLRHRPDDEHWIELTRLAVELGAAAAKYDMAYKAFFTKLNEKGSHRYAGAPDGLVRHEDGSVAAP